MHKTLGSPILRAPDSKVRRVSEIGHSMVEMLGVLVVMAILTIGGLRMYNSAKEKAKINAVEKRVQSMALDYQINSSGRTLTSGTRYTLSGPYNLEITFEEGTANNLKDYFWITVPAQHPVLCEGLKNSDAIQAKFIMINGELNGNCPGNISFYFPKNFSDTTDIVTYTDGNGQQQPCPQNAECTSDDFNCHEGYYKDGNGCQKCPLHVATCQDENTPITCEGDYYGDNCENEPLSCQNGGTWNTSEHKCDCVSGYTGTTCETMDLCANIDCGSHGSCSNGVCVCTDNYYGDNCENKTCTANIDCPGVCEGCLISSGQGANTCQNMCQEVGYLESTGTQYIDTGVSGNNNNLEISLKFNLLAYSQYGGLFGNYVAETSYVWRILQQSSNNTSMYLGANTRAGSSTTITNITKNVAHTITYSRSGIVVDGGASKVVSSLSTTANANATSIVLFRQKSTANSSKMRLYYFKIKDGSSLIRDFVPVLAPDKGEGKTGVVPAMLDQVNNKVYYNAGTGVFSYGFEHGQCTNGTCTCTDNYYGANCETAPLSCQNGGTWNTTTHQCDCVSGYEGDACETLIDPCIGATDYLTSCVNSNGKNGYCVSGSCKMNGCFTNDDCATNQYCNYASYYDDNCSDSTVASDGTGSGGYQGECKNITSNDYVERTITGFGGSLTPVSLRKSKDKMNWWSAVNWCAAQPSTNAGSWSMFNLHSPRVNKLQCYNGSKTAFGNATLGYCCSPTADSCDATVTNQSTVMQQLRNSTTGFGNSGSLWTQNTKNACTVFFIGLGNGYLNHNNRHYDYGSYYALCEEINSCTGVYCGAHGSCSNGTCTCTDNYYGTNCENAPLTCQNGGTWNTTTHQCDCASGYTGTTCENTICTANIDCPDVCGGCSIPSGQSSGICQNMCQEVGYLESTGTQYIDTELVLPNGFRIKGNIEKTASSGAAGIFGCYGASPNYNRNFFSIPTNQSWMVGYGGTAYQYFGSVSANVKYSFDITNIHGRESLKINGTSYQMSLTDGSKGTFDARKAYLFGLNSNGSPSIKSHLKMYDIQVYNDADVLVRDFVPVLAPDKGQGKTGVVPAMLDQVNNKVYYNAGTGTFSYGS